MNNEPTTLESAADVLGTAPELPRATPGAGAVNAPATTDQAATMHLTLTDDAGEAWNPAIHVKPARKNVKGRWARRPGNAQRAAKGLPPSGVAGQVSTSRVVKTSDEITENTEKTDTPTPSVLEAERFPDPIASVPPTITEPTSSEAGAAPVVDIETPLAAYKGTATVINDGIFGFATLKISAAWKQDPKEREAFIDCWQRSLHYLQTPLLNPLVELLGRFIFAIARRSDDPDTRSFTRRVWDWITGHDDPTWVKKDAEPVTPTPAAATTTTTTTTADTEAPPHGRPTWLKN